MKLEEEIKVKGFESEYQKAVLNIVFTHSWLSSFQTKFFKGFGISPQQYNILRILRGQHPKPASVSLLMDKMLDKMSNASRLVEKLRKKGFVERRECQVDRRQVDVLITGEGLALLEEIDKHPFPRHFETITVEEAGELNRILDKLRD